MTSCSASSSSARSRTCASLLGPRPGVTGVRGGRPLDRLADFLDVAAALTASPPVGLTTVVHRVSVNRATSVKRQPLDSPARGRYRLRPSRPADRCATVLGTCPGGTKGPAGAAAGPFVVPPPLVVLVLVRTGRFRGFPGSPWPAPGRLPVR